MIDGNHKRRLSINWIAAKLACFSIPQAIVVPLKTVVNKGM